MAHSSNKLPQLLTEKNTTKNNKRKKRDKIQQRKPEKDEISSNNYKLNEQDKSLINLQ